MIVAEHGYWVNREVLDQGWRLNRPNDVVVKSDGSIYFTDPMTFNVDSDLDVCGVYRVAPDLGSIHCLIRDFVLPNGLCFSPDESILYINDSRWRHIRAFHVEPTGLLALATDRVFCTMTGDRPGNPDGMKVDVEGNVYCSGPGGIWILDSAGTHLGTILTREPVTNIAWGDHDWRTLYITTRQLLARIRLQIPGDSCPARDALNPCIAERNTNAVYPHCFEVKTRQCLTCYNTAIPSLRYREGRGKHR